ncbi:serine/threonine-protein kinase Nek2-like [Paramacrobiotus metropolitanus]|uniref:serine/threonine-protein kinase Nek2-like n=1 Tax=Paramacrobiotus metropolitanus TaxID=2943436 RepID=UPI0024455FB9|nr:serine/threonine-protein kinase Nek2-like [Paramacrobiotus metropolitanus]
MEVIPIEPVSYGKTCRYQIAEGEHIAQGSFGYVYAATITEYGDYVGAPTVTVKVAHLKKNIFTAEQSRQKLVRRYETLVNIHHDHIAAYHQISIDLTKPGPDCTVHLMMDYYASGDLAGLLAEFQKHNQLRRNPPHEHFDASSLMQLDVETAAACMSQIANGLGFLHQNNIVHGDLKPGNIFIRLIQGNEAVREVLVIGDLDDFIQIEHSSAGTAHLHGSFRYMSPEMCGKYLRDPPTEVGMKTDIWSLGCIMLEMVNCMMEELWMFDVDKGNKKRGDNVDAESFIRLVEAGFVLLEPKHTPAGIAEAIRRCLWYDSETRATAEELLPLLRSPRSKAVKSEERRRRRGPCYQVLAAVAGLVTFIASCYKLWKYFNE